MYQASGRIMPSVSQRGGPRPDPYAATTPQQTYQAPPQILQQGQQHHKDPLEGKSVVLYIGDNVGSNKAFEYASRCPLIHIKHIKDISGPLPQWLRGTPTALSIPSREVFMGERAIQFVAGVAEPWILQNGAQRQAIVGTDPNSINYKDQSWEDPTFKAASTGPVGIGASSRTLGQFAQFKSDPASSGDDSKYGGSSSISDAELQKFQQRRAAPATRPAFIGYGGDGVPITM